GSDAFSLAIVHTEGEEGERVVVQDVMKSWARGRSGPIDLEGVVKEIAALLRAYHLRLVYGDRYSANWIIERFKAEGIKYELPSVKSVGETEPSYLDKSRAYQEIEPLFAQGRLALLDHPQMVRELKLLERRPRAGGRTLIDHPAGGHDDLANALSLAVA